LYMQSVTMKVKTDSPKCSFNQNLESSGSLV
jgi:hypothetical protein